MTAPWVTNITAIHHLSGPSLPWVPEVLAVRFREAGIRGSRERNKRDIGDL